MLGDAQGRDQNVSAELALDATASFGLLDRLAQRRRHIEGAGIVMIVFSPKLASTVYDIPAVAVTSSPFTTPRRPCPIGAGRPRPSTSWNASSTGRRAMKIDPAELRKKT
jgi:hypothetical protein